MAQLYYDTFADEVVTEIDTIAPPERYIWVYCGKVGAFKERWSIGNSKYLDIAYTSADRENGLVDSIRQSVADNYKVNLGYITDWIVPPEHYKKMKESINGKIQNEK